MNYENEIDEENNENRVNFIISNALNYYDMNQENILKLLKKVKYFSYVVNLNTLNQIILYDDNFNTLLSSSYEIVSVYNPNNNIWKWSWSISSLEKKYTIISRKILEYALNLDPIKENLLRTKLINSDIKINNKLQLDIYLALSSYISKKPFILTLPIIETKPFVKTINGKSVNLGIYRDTFDFSKNNNSLPLISFYYIYDYKPN